MSKDDDEVVLSRFVWLTRSCSDDAAETDVEAEIGASSVVLVESLFWVEPPPRNLRGTVVKADCKTSWEEASSDRSELCEVYPVTPTVVGEPSIVEQDVLLLDNPLRNLLRSGEA